MLNALLHRLVERLPLVARTLRALRYRKQLSRGQSAGEIRYRATPGTTTDHSSLTIFSNLDHTVVRSWLEPQTIQNVEISYGTNPTQGWFFAPGSKLPAVPPSWLESALLVASTERVGAITFSERVIDAPEDTVTSADELLGSPWRPLSLFSALAYRWDAETDTVHPQNESLPAKFVGRDGVGSGPFGTSADSPLRRGPYVGHRPLPALLEIGLDTEIPELETYQGDSKPAVLVTAPFLARGGAEHTLFETLKVLQENCRIAFATMAPHRPELDDRRDDFEQLSPHLFSLGDWVHPDAMMPMLIRLIDRLGIDVLYNANSTTLFYDFVPQLKSARPTLRVVDHLYDHRVGYIDRYRDSSLLLSIDACIAENHPIARVLTGEFGWPSDRTPVIWSCGRSSTSLPAEDRWETIRNELRATLGYSESDVVFITAARMHEQKRPLDLVRLAEMVAERPDIHFLVVGGGPMEAAVDQAIAKAQTTRIRRMSFRTDIPELILASDAGLLVSAFEGLPVFLLECLQMGRPFLGTDVGDVGRVLRETGAGLIIDTPGDIEALAAAVRLMADSDVRRGLAEKSLPASRKFSPEHCAREYARALFGEDWTENQ